MPLDASIKKTLVIGSGPIVIGQAAEFDYAGAQACKVLKAAGINTVLINSNPATIMTDKALADEIYLEPLTTDTVKRIIEKEKPDSLLASLGGQTGLTIASGLSREGYLDKHGVRLLGTSASAIDKAEDRELFKETMEKIGQPVIPSGIATVLSAAVETASRIGYPVIVRPAFTLGGAGGGVAYDEETLIPIVENGLWLSPISQVLIEKYIYGYKEIEFEVMRDGAGSAIAVCSMENFDPVGVHTGDSVVIAPAVTLSDKEYQMLRSAALDIIDELAIEGGCNCQFALAPDSFEYAVIEVNPRVSRSSALASKATGYPIAKVSAQIALGYTLDEIQNAVTGKTCACFEPAIDYAVVKLPKWPFDKFTEAKSTLGTQMKATGEVMAIAGSFENALMKAVRGAEIRMDSLRLDSLIASGLPAVMESLKTADTLRPFRLFAAVYLGADMDELFEITRIDRWFLNKIKNLADFEKLAEAGPLTGELYAEGKRLGYTDEALLRISGGELPQKRMPVYKMVDTCAGEFAAKTPYFYATHDDVCESRPLPREGKMRVVVLGSGPIRIGQGIEFDYSSVHCVWTLKDMGYEVIIINNNPETVSTDFDTADRLYFEPLTLEDVLGVLEVEKPLGVVVAFGGQTAIRLAKALDARGIRILGTSAESIDLAEDRERFDALLESLNIRRPKGCAVRTLAEALAAAENLGYPVLIRPSYVIGGQNMTIAYSGADITRYMGLITEQGNTGPVLVDKYLMGVELEVDALCDGESVLIPGVMEHIERAGVHSGDSIAVYPPYHLSDTKLETLVDCSAKLALSMKTRGLVNIQYVLYQNQIYVIEVNPRASRTIPYISKVTGVPMTDVATRLMLGASLKDFPYGTGLYKAPPYVTAKVPVFSFEKLSDANAALGPEMKSTGEVLGIGKTLEEALYKGLLAAGFRIPRAGERAGAFISVNRQDQYEVVSLAKKMSDLGMRIYATDGTAGVIERLGVDVTRVKKLREGDEALRLLESGVIDCVVYSAGGDRQSAEDFITLHRRAMQLSIACFSSLDTAGALCDIMRSRFDQYNTELVDLNNMRAERRRLSFAKMEAGGNDYIYCENFTGEISCPESLAISLTDRHTGIGGDGLVLMEESAVADARMRIFNKDGSEGDMAGNSIRCVAKYLYDKGIVKKRGMTIETKSGVRSLYLHFMNSLVSSVNVDMGKASMLAESLPVTLDTPRVINRPIEVLGKEYLCTCCSIGNPHCVTFCERVDDVDIKSVGPAFERLPIFPRRVNTEFARVVDPRTLKLRVWERGNGDTDCCGTGACAAVIAATELGYCEKGVEITVKQKGGDLRVRYTDETVELRGPARLVFEGTVEY